MKEEVEYHEDGDPGSQQDGVIQQLDRLVRRLLVDPEHGLVDQLLQSFLILLLLGLLDVQHELLTWSPG